MNHNHKYLSTYSFTYLISVSLDQLIFFVLISHEIALDTRLMLLSFFSYNPIILYITLLVENAKNMFSIFRVISAVISFLVAVVREYPGFETSRCIKAEYLYELM